MKSRELSNLCFHILNKSQNRETDRRFEQKNCNKYSIRMAEGDAKGSGRLGVVQTAFTTDNWDKSDCVTFVMHKEDHTLGNALRYMIMKDPDVDFCGYSVPHPTEKRINLRIQTKGTPAADVFDKGLTNLSAVCDHIQQTFKENIQKFKEESMES